MSLSNCNLSTLITAAKCYDCLSQTEKDALKVQFMAMALKGNGGVDWTNVNVRQNAVACWCEPKFRLQSMEVAIWAAFATDSGQAPPSTIQAQRNLIRCIACDGKMERNRAAEVAILCRLIGTGLVT